MNFLRTALTAGLFIVGSSAAFANTCLATYTETAEPVLARKCAACHNDASPGSGVSFQKGSGYDFLVNVASEQLPTMNRVTPGDTSQSYLAHKISDTHESVGGSGGKMPPSGRLREAEVEAIIAWIEGCTVEQ
ncbi:MULTISPECIES: c-type cytochrome [unclassified Devosia]|uniref:c-type cytochrome n=1 Tax=unclassified Devosia TaxID=196773 RepID=UPI00145C52B3|nr:MULTISPECIES: c-type cytochrome [unclassified Devosia]MBK1794173.1 c-type cytochrome [Devosia sp. WQ 349K1]